jgi:hypothetical protein
MGFGSQVAVAAGNPGVSITDLIGDFNLTAGTGTLSKVTTPVDSLAAGISCMRTFGGAQTCPQADHFTPGAQNLAITDSLVTSAGFIGSAVIDTISQSVTSAPESPFLVLLGAALVDFGLAHRPQRRVTD